MLTKQTLKAIAKRGYGVDGARIGNYTYELRAGWDLELWRAWKNSENWEYIGIFNKDYSVTEKN